MAETETTVAPAAATSSDPITAAIESSMTAAGLHDTGDTDAGDSSDSGDSSSDDGLSVETSAAVSPSASTAGADPAAAAATAAAAKTAPVETPEQKAEREDLEAVGLKAPKEGERENRLPHSRVVKMVLKGVQRGREQAAAQIAEKDTKIGELEGTVAEYTRMNVFADRDPDRFLEALAVANPRVWKPILQKLQGAPAAATEVKAAPGGFDTPMPKPNFKLPDGSMTYDDAGLASLLEWNEAKAVAIAEDRITKKFEERFGPIEEDHKRVSWEREQAPKIAALTKQARETWGKLFDDDYQKAENGGQSEILAYMKQHKMPLARFHEAVQAVLLPKLRADRTKMRGEIIEELNAAPAASVEHRTQVKERPVPTSIEQAIRDSVAAAGLTL